MREFQNAGGTKREYIITDDGHKIPIFKGGKGGDGGAAKAAEKSYQLQFAQFELEKSNLLEQKRLQSEEELKKRLFGEKAIQNKKVGAAATILTGGASDIGTPKISSKSLYGS